MQSLQRKLCRDRRWSRVRLSMYGGPMRIPILQVTSVDVVRDELKRKAEERVIDAIKNKLPSVGEKGSILEYHQSPYQPLRKKSKLVQHELYIDDDVGGEEVGGGEENDQEIENEWSNEIYAVKGSQTLVHYPSSDDEKE
jgi:hypothetical protein